jgi:hypothetical protein
MNNIRSLRIQTPKVRAVSLTKTPVATPISVFSNTTPIETATIKPLQANILTTRSRRQSSTTSDPSPPSRRQSTIISEPTSRTQSIANFTGIISSRNLTNKPPNYNPNFKIPINNKTRKNRVNNTKKIKKNMNILQSYGPNARNTFKKYKNMDIPKNKILNLVKQETQLRKNYLQQNANRIQNWTKSTNRVWYNPLTWKRTRKLRK